MADKTTAKNGAVKVHTLDVKALGDLVRQLHVERFGPLHRKIQERRDHLFNDPSVNPVLLAPYAGKSTFQTTRLRKIAVDMKSRLTENPPIFRVHPPRNTPRSQQRADTFEAVLASGWKNVQLRQQIDIVSGLVDGLLGDCYGVFHWRKFSELWPRMGELETCDSLPEDTEEAKRFKETDDGKYVETDDSFQDREKRRKAHAGYPWYMEAVNPTTFSFDTDISTANGMSVAITVTDIAVLEYARELDKKQIYLSLGEQKKDIRAYRAAERPEDWMPSGPQWAGKKVTVATVWTRDEFYEMVSEGGAIGATGTTWEIVQSGHHPYGMPPFSLATADVWNVPEPLRHYEPALAGMMRLKPMLDFIEAMGEILAISTAAPIFVLESENTPGTFAVTQDGKQMVLSLDAAMATEMPPGYHLRDIRGEIGTGFMQYLESRRREFIDLMPQIGITEVGASTTAWNMMLQMEQAAVPIKRYLNAIVQAIQIGQRSMASVMAMSAEDGGFGEPIYTFAMTKDGKVDKSTVVGVKPEEIETLEIDVGVNPRGAAERIAHEQHGLTLLGAGLITTVEFQSEFRQVPDPWGVVAELMAERISRPFIEMDLQQQLTAHYGNKIMTGPGGELVGPGGAAVEPEQAVTQAAAASPMSGVNNGIAGGLQALPPLSGPSMNGAP